MPTYLFLRRLRRSPAAFSGLTLVILLVLTALFAPWLAPHDPNWQDAAARLQGPGAGHWLGTDSYGRDLLSRLLYGARPALGLVALVTAITLPVGLLVGILSGYYGGWLERILMRFTDVVMSMPRLILAFAFVAMLGPGLVNGALALALTTWPAYALEDFAFSLHDLSAEASDLAQASAAIVFCVDGEAVLRKGDQSLTLKPGESAFVAASESPVQVSGRGRVARVFNKL